MRQSGGYNSQMTPHQRLRAKRPGGRRPRPRPRRRLRRALFLLAAVAFAFAAAVVAVLWVQYERSVNAPCTAKYAQDGGQAAKVRDALDLVAATGSAAPLAELTPPGWDTVYAFPAPLVAAGSGVDPADGGVDTDAVVGCDTQLPYRSTEPLGSVLFFLRDGKTVRTLEVGHDLVPPTGPWRYTSNTRVTPTPATSDCPAPCLRLTEQ